MICEIQPPNPNIANAVAYNERKMNGENPRGHERDESLSDIEDGYVIGTRNVPDGASLLEEFHRLKILGLKSGKHGPKTRNTTFHMSVNPSVTDRPLSDKEAAEFIDEIMAGLGYGDQPYRIYKHTDIARMHYHVVTTRNGQDGRKISDSYERRKLRAVLEPLREKYGFTLVELKDENKAVTAAQRLEVEDDEGEVRKARRKDRETPQAASPEEKPRSAVVPPYSGKSPVSASRQIADAFEDTLRWNYTTFAQLQMLMLRRYNVLAELQRRGEDDETVVLYGTDAAGVPCTPQLDGEKLFPGMLEQIRRKTSGTKMSSKRMESKRINDLTKIVARESQTWEDFKATMSRKGVYVVLSWNANGEPFGVTYLDRATRCAWKGSETAVGMDFISKTAREKGWTLTKDKYQQLVEKRNAMPSRREALTPAPKQAPAPKPATPVIRQENGISGIRKALRSMMNIRPNHPDGQGQSGRASRASFQDDYEDNGKKGKTNEI